MWPMLALSWPSSCLYLSAEKERNHDTTSTLFRIIFKRDLLSVSFGVWMTHNEQEVGSPLLRKIRRVRDHQYRENNFNYQTRLIRLGNKLREKSTVTKRTNLSILPSLLQMASDKLPTQFYTHFFFVHLHSALMGSGPILLLEKFFKLNGLYLYCHAFFVCLFPSVSIKKKKKAMFISLPKSKQCPLLTTVHRWLLSEIVLK